MNIENNRNRTSKKKLITDNDVLEIEAQRDRNADFEPALIPKRVTRIDGLDQKIISLYAKGMSLAYIKLQPEELYGAEVSESLISRITDNGRSKVLAKTSSRNICSSFF